MADSARNQQDSLRVSLTEALAILDRTEPVTPQAVDLAAAAGLTLAGDAVTDETKLRLTGARLRRIDIAQLIGAGAARIDVRVPRFLVVRDNDEVPAAVRAMISGAVESEGGMAKQATGSLQAVLTKDDFDAAIVFGDGRAAQALRKTAQIAFDGVALMPGDETAFGIAHGRPFLLLPADFSGALAGWLAVGRRLLARLAFRLIEEQPFLLELARPVPSQRGLAEVVPVRRRAAQVEPMPGDWTAAMIARADGWILVPAESEGLAAGTKVQMRPWP